MSSDAALALSPLDTARWGVATVRAEARSAARVTEVIAEATALGAGLLVVRCPAEAVDAAQALGRAGALLMDTLVTYVRPLASLPPREGVHPVRVASEADAAAVRVLARDVFAGYRGHYHADPRLDPARCDEVYADWAERSCASRAVADEVLLVEDVAVAGRLLGFATLQADAGVLFGVATAAQGRGIYRALMIAAMHALAARGSPRMRVTTQLVNVAVQKVWVRLGFEPASATYTFHRWSQVQDPFGVSAAEYRGPQ